MICSHFIHPPPHKNAIILIITGSIQSAPVEIRKYISMGARGSFAPAALWGRYMVFHSLQFLIFFPITILVYYILPPKCRHLWLLAASYYYYMCWNIRYALLMLLSTFITYLSGIWMERVKNRNWEPKKKTNRKRWIVFLSFFLNLAILFFFK